MHHLPEYLKRCVLDTEGIHVFRVSHYPETIRVNSINTLFVLKQTKVLATNKVLNSVYHFHTPQALKN